MTRMCALNPKVECDGDGEGPCQCVPTAWPGSPEEWREMTPAERQAMCDGAADVLLTALASVVFGKENM